MATTNLPENTANSGMNKLSLRIDRKRFSHREVAFTSLLLFLLFSIAYVNSRVIQNYDSLNYAFQAEARGLKAIQGNHPLGHVILDALFLLAQHFGYSIRALPLFQFVNGIIGGATVAALFVVCALVLENTTLSSFGLALFLGGSYTFWHLAGTGDIYSLTVLFSLLAWGAMALEVRLGERATWFLPGVLVGPAILTHQFNILLVIVGLVFITNQHNNRTVKMISFVGPTAFIVITGYLFSGYSATSSTSLPDIIRWASGFFGQGNPQYGGGLNIQELPVALSTLAGTLIAPFRFLPARIAFLLTLGFTLFLGGSRFNLLSPFRKLVLIVSTLQFLGGALLVLWWEPGNQKYWLLTFVPMIMAFACLSANTVQRIPGCAIALRGRSYAAQDFLWLLLGGILILFNLAFGVIPEQRSAALLQDRLELWTENSSKDDVLIPRQDWSFVPYLLYWYGRPNTFELGAPSFGDWQEKGLDSKSKLAKLGLSIDSTLQAGKIVLIASDAVDTISDDRLFVSGMSRDQLRDFFNQYGQEEFFSYTWSGERIRVYRITKRNAGQ